MICSAIFAIFNNFEWFVSILKNVVFIHFLWNKYSLNARQKLMLNAMDGLMDRFMEQGELFEKDFDDYDIM